MRVILDPLTVAMLLDKLTEPELLELRKVCEADTELEMCVAASEWLLKRFPHIGASVRRAVAADMN